MAVGGWMGLLLACAGPPDSAVPPAPPPVEVPVAPWPAGPLTLLPARPAPTGVLLLDAGHGAPGNSGNVNWTCESEADTTRRLADGLLPTLLADGLAVARTRPDARLVDYDRRMEQSRSATWLVSLHSDSRAGDGPVRHPQTGCVVATGAAGFAVLWSDEGDSALVPRRQALARAIATRMAEAGFAPYPGLDYPGYYDADAVPGVFVDRHAPHQRIRLLRRPRVPSVIVETHQAWDPAEAARWEEPATREAFARALSVAIGDVGAGG